MVTIIISGMPGSGKSTVAKHLAKKLKLRHVSAGDKMRGIAGGLSIAEFNEFHDYLKKHDEIDRKIDSMIIREARKGNVIIDGVLAGYTVKKADYKIFLKLTETEAAERIAGREKASIKEALTDIKTRWNGNRKRWKRIYGIDINDLNPYNLILDTSQWTINEMNKIIEFIIKELLKSKGGAVN